MIIGLARGSVLPRKIAVAFLGWRGSALDDFFAQKSASAFRLSTLQRPAMVGSRPRIGTPGPNEFC
jgi:hypothetical protein